MNSFLRSALCACCLAVPLAHAQLSPGTQPPAALDGIPATGSSCGRDDDSSEPAGGAIARKNPAGDAANYDCALDADKLQAMLSAPNLMLADLRSPAAFAAFHIPPAVNVSPGALASKSYWRNKRLVLIGDGKGEHELYVQCAHLKRRGYAHVQVLRGGVAQWQAHALPLNGRAPALAAQIRLSATEFWQETRNPRNLVLLDTRLAALAHGLASARTIPAPTAEAIVGALRDRRNAGVTAIVLATADGFVDARIEELSRAVRPVPILVYSGSVDEYRNQLALQQAVWKAREQGPRTPRCGT
ncbi:MAG: rhodanese-like domain-containing protein [Candidatus Accumulibacter sp.]|jgi:rhodanese-related sulfurtransferase|nr:rhodanese-like domain-containing protein [Accumulibacter sp.]